MVGKGSFNHHKLQGHNELIKQPCCSPIIIFHLHMAVNQGPPNWLINGSLHDSQHITVLWDGIDFWKTLDISLQNSNQKIRHDPTLNLL